MATFFERLELIVDANVAGAVKGLGLTSTQAAGLEKQTTRLGRAMPYVAAGAVVVGAALYKSLGAYSEQESANLRLQNSLKRNPLLAGASADAFLDQAAAIQKVTVASDESVVGAQALLATFRLTKSEIMGLTPLVVDYARKFGTDLETAAKQVGKAMDGQVGALKRNGVTIDETMFKTDRYRAVMEALRGQVGGFAEEEAETAQGKILQLQNSLNEIAEAIGGAVAPAVKVFAGLLGELTSDADATRIAVTGIGVAAGFYFGGPLGAAVGAAAANMDLLADATKKTLEPTDAVKRAAKEAGVSVEEYVRAAWAGRDASAGLSVEEAELAAKVAAVEGAIKRKTEAVWASVDAQMAARGASLSAQEAQARYNEVMSDPKSSPLERARAEFQLEQSFYASAKAAGEAAAAQLKGGSESEKAKASTEAQIASLTFLAGTLAPGSPLRTNLEAHIAALQRTGGTFSSTIFANTEPARLALESLIAQYNGRQINFGTGVVTPAGIAASRGYTIGLDGQLYPHASGGVFTQPHMGLVAEAGPEAIIPLNNPARASQVMAQAGLGGGSRVYNVNVNVPLGADPASVGREIRFALDAYDRRIGRNN